MNDSRISRRSVLAAATAVSVLSGVSSRAVTAAVPVGPRIRLTQPGPMVPPVPAILLSVNGMPGDPDEISVVWTFVVEGEPPQVGISAGDHHLARKLVEHHGEFVLNVPVASIVESFDTVDMNSTYAADKFGLAGLTRGKAVAVNAPTVEECPIHVECRVFDMVRVPPARKVFFADVVATTAIEGAVDENGRLNVENVPFFGMTAGSGEFYTMGERVAHIGYTRGRTDIKY